MKMSLILLKRVIILPSFLLLFAIFCSDTAQTQEPDVIENDFSCSHLPASISDELKMEIGKYCPGPVILEEAVYWFSDQNDRFFISACIVNEAILMDKGAMAVLISMDDFEYIYLKRPDRDFNIFLATTVWEKDGVRPGTFEVFNGGLWVMDFAGGIYDHLIALPFARRTQTSMEDIVEIASARICHIDHSRLTEPRPVED